MAHEKDYVPGPDAAFDGWLENLVQYAQGKTDGNKPEWDFIRKSGLILRSSAPAELIKR